MFRCVCVCLLFLFFGCLFFGYLFWFVLVAIVQIMYCILVLVYKNYLQIIKVFINLPSTDDSWGVHKYNKHEGGVT